MNKKEAAEFLGVSERAIERYTASGKLHPVYVKGRTGQAPDFDRSELEKIKEQMEQPAKLKRIGKGDKSDNADSPTGALQRRASNPLLQLLGLVEAAGITDKSAAVSITDKLMLTLDQAGELSELPRAMLKRDIDAGKLKAIKTGRGYRIKRADLDAYIRKL